jgi:hypothetical protein
MISHAGVNTPKGTKFYDVVMVEFKWAAFSAGVILTVSAFGGKRT